MILEIQGGANAPSSPPLAQGLSQDHNFCQILQGQERHFALISPLASMVEVDHLAVLFEYQAVNITFCEILVVLVCQYLHQCK